jgi:hypothetical protein
MGNLQILGAQPHLTWDICICMDASSDLDNLELPADMSIYMMFPHKWIHIQSNSRQLSVDMDTSKLAVGHMLTSMCWISAPSEFNDCAKQ